jgi:hypothetical protein
LILVDTSIWIDFFRGVDSPHRKKLHELIKEEADICLCNVILTEILQGIKSDKEFAAIKEYLLCYPIYSLRNVNSYVEAAGLYRRCRQKGYLLHKTIDVLIAMVAIENELLLFHKDKDFDKIAKVASELKTYKFS